jgi:hypothetical protein
MADSVVMAASSTVARARAYVLVFVLGRTGRWE